MRSVAVGSLVTLILFTGLIVSQVEAKTDKDDGKGKNKQAFNLVSKIEAKTDKHNGKEKNKPDHPIVAKNYTHNDTRSVPIPGTLLLLGGGFAGLAAWRARQRKPRA
jgi:hypothetical protein